MKWTVTFFDERVEKETLNFPAGVLANLPAHSRTDKRVRP